MKIRRARFLVCSLIAGCIVITTSQVSLAAKNNLPEWAKIEKGEDFEKRYGEEDAVVLLDRWDIEVKGGKRTGTHRWVIRILNEDGMKYGGFALTRSDFQAYSKVKCWVKQKSGRVRVLDEEDGTLTSHVEFQQLDDTEVLILKPPGLAPGAEMAVEYRFRSEPDLPQDLFTVQRAVPVRLAEFKVDTRKGWKVLARTASGDNPGPTEVTEEGVWRFEHVAGREPLEGSYAPVPPRTELFLDYVAPGTESPFSDWNSTARWVKRLYGLPSGQSVQLKQARSRIQSAKGDVVEESVRLARKLRYFAVELGWGGWIPRPPDKTLARAFGDCKDKSQVMIMILGTFGRKAYPVLTISPTDRYVDDAVPSPFVFNHVVVGLPWADSDQGPGMTVVDVPGIGPLRIIDVTMSDTSPQDMSSWHEGAVGLVIDDRTTGLIRFPGSGANENRVESITTVNVDTRGNLSTRTEIRTGGVRRRGLEGDEGELITSEKLRERIVNRLLAICPEFDGLEVGDVERQADGIWTYESSYACPAGLAAYGDMSVMDLGRVRSLGTFPLPEEEDEDSQYQPYLGTYLDRLDLRVNGPSLAQLPKPSEISNSLGSVTMEVKETGTGLLLERKVVVSALEVPPSKRAEAEALRQALRRINSVSLLFENSDSPD